MSSSLRALDLLRTFPVTLGIGALTVLMFGILQTEGGGTDLSWHLRLGALRADRLTEHAEYYRLLTPTFLHFGWTHLILDGVLFLLIGALVETLWGGRRLLLFYVVAGIGASLTSAVLNGAGVAASVGSSGAISGLAGVVLGTALYGQPPTRSWLVELLSRRLLYFLVLAMGLEFGLWLTLPVVDHWAHVGGFVTGLLLAAATPDPTDEDPLVTVPAAAAAGAVVVGALAWMAVDGPSVLETADLDIARSHRIAVSEQPGGLGTLLLLLRMLDGYDRAEAVDEGNEAFGRAVLAFDDPILIGQLTGLLTFQQEVEGKDRGEVLHLTAERWLALAPDDPAALNAMAWLLVTGTTADPDRAEALSRQSLDALGPDDDTLRAMYLDTLGEILFQQGDLEAALVAQREAVTVGTIATEARWFFNPLPGLPMDEIEGRLAKIEAAAGG